MPANFVAAGGGWIYVLDGYVPGWNAKPIDPTDNSNPFANMIEMQWTPANLAYSGVQRIDMLGAMNQEFYQIVPTTQGTNVYYFYRGTNAGEIVQFICGDENSPSEVRTDTMVSGWTLYSGKVTVPTASTYFGFLCLNGTEGYGNATYNGQSYIGIKTGGGGAYLDDIKFQTQSKLLIDKSVSTREPEGALLDEILTYTIMVSNYGQTDTSKTVLEDVLGDDVEFVGNVKIDGVEAGSLASFDQSTDTLTVMLGNGAAAGSGGSLEGTVSADSTPGGSTVITFEVKVIGEFGSKIRNQAAVSYDDKDFENQSGGGYTDYSNVTEVEIVNKDCYSIEVKKGLTEAAKAVPVMFENKRTGDHWVSGDGYVPNNMLRLPGA